MSMRVNVKLLTGKCVIVDYDVEDSFEIFKAKVAEKLSNIVDIESASENTEYSVLKLLRLICCGRELNDEYYESVKTEFPKINCIHAVCKALLKDEKNNM